MCASNLLKTSQKTRVLLEKHGPAVRYTLSLYIYIYDMRRDDMGLGVAALDVCAGVFAML